MLFLLHSLDTLLEGKFRSSHCLFWAAVQKVLSLCLFSYVSVSLNVPFSPIYLAKTYLSLKVWLKEHLHFKALLTQDPGRRNKSLFFLWCYNTFLVSLLLEHHTLIENLLRTRHCSKCFISAYSNSLYRWKLRHKDYTARKWPSQYLNPSS